MSAAVPPVDLAAERAVLGAALLDARAVELLVPVPADVFHTDAHRSVATAVQRLAGRGAAVEPGTVKHELEAMGAWEPGRFATILAGLVEEGVVAASVPHYLAIVQEYAVRRRLMQEGYVLTTRAADVRAPVEETLATHVGRCLTLERGAGPDTILTPQAWAAELRQGRMPTRLATGLRVFDQVAGGGLTTGDLAILAGRPGLGKTAAAVQSLARVSRELPVLLLSLEMPREQIGQRYLGLASVETLAASGFYIDDSTALTITEVVLRIRRAVRDYAVQFVVLDHVGKVKPSRSRERRDLEVEEVVVTLRDLAKSLDLPILVLCQLSRAVERRNSQRPVLADLRDSGALEQEAAMVAFLWSPEDRLAGKSTVEVFFSLEKNRHGPTGDVSAVFHRATGRIDDGSPA